MIAQAQIFETTTLYARIDIEVNTYCNEKLVND